jgi:outer membrane protein OmpA-like peptidoglycan-associated protein
MSLGLSSGVFADEHIRGVIAERGSDGTVTVQTDDSKFVMVLSDATKVHRTDGFRVMRASSSLLIPGLRIEAHGAFDAGNRFIAEKIDFTRADLKTAQAIAGGVNPTDQRSRANQQKIEQNAQLLRQQQQTLDHQAREIAANRDRINANDQKLVATTGALEATNARIGNLADYTTLDTVTVYFGNAKTSIASEYRAQLESLAARARNMPGYVVQVQGFASAVGSNSLNQRLSKERADNVTALLQQNGVPLTNIVVPAAMGTTQQVASNKSKKGQAENRRTVVTLLQNKGLTESK